MEDDTGTAKCLYPVLAGACPIVGSFGRRDPMGTGHPGRLEQALTDLGKLTPEMVRQQRRQKFLDIGRKLG